MLGGVSATISLPASSFARLHQLRYGRPSPVSSRRFVLSIFPSQEFPLTSSLTFISQGGISKGDIKSLGKLMKAFWAEVDKVKADGAEVGKVAKELLMGEGPKA